LTISGFREKYLHNIYIFVSEFVGAGDMMTYVVGGGIIHGGIVDSIGDVDGRKTIYYLRTTKHRMV
jgi:hypothetical protein